MFPRVNNVNNLLNVNIFNVKTNAPSNWIRDSCTALKKKFKEEIPQPV